MSSVEAVQAPLSVAHGDRDGHASASALAAGASPLRAALGPTASAPPAASRLTGAAAPHAGARAPSTAAARAAGRAAGAAGRAARRGVDAGSSASRRSGSPLPRRSPAAPPRRRPRRRRTSERQKGQAPTRPCKAARHDPRAQVYFKFRSIGMLAAGTGPPRCRPYLVSRS